MNEPIIDPTKINLISIPQLVILKNVEKSPYTMNDIQVNNKTMAIRLPKAMPIKLIKKHKI